MKEHLLLLAVFLFWTMILAFGANAFNCNQLTSADSPASVISQPCKVLTTDTTYNFIVENIENQAWEKFTNQVEEFDGVSITIKNSPFKTFSLPKLTRFKKTGLIIEDNPNLEEIVIKPTSYLDAAYILVRDNPKLKSISVGAESVSNSNLIRSLKITNNDELTTITVAAKDIKDNKGYAWISNNKKLETIDMPKLTSIAVGQGILIENNPNLKSIGWKALTELKSDWGPFLIRNNDKLENVEMALKEMNVQEDSSISNNDKLKSIKMAATDGLALRGITIAQNDELTEIDLGNPGVFTSRYVTITNNPKLASLKPIEKFTGTNLLVQNNNKLPVSVIDALNALKMEPSKTRTVQNPGDCSFSKKISDLTEIDGCKKIRGNLELKKGAKIGTVKTVLTDVDGNIDLADLPESKMAFLKGAKITGSIVSDTCGLFTVHKLPVRSSTCAGNGAIASAGNSSRSPGGVTAQPGEAAKSVVKRRWKENWQERKKFCKQPRNGLVFLYLFLFHHCWVTVGFAFHNWVQYNPYFGPIEGQLNEYEAYVEEEEDDYDEEEDDEEPHKKRKKKTEDKKEKGKKKSREKKSEDKEAPKSSDNKKDKKTKKSGEGKRRTKKSANSGEEESNPNRSD